MVHSRLQGRRPLRLSAADLRAAYHTLLDLALWRDRWAVGLIASGLVLNLGLLAYVVARLPTLPELLPLHYGATGEVDYIGHKSELIWLPVIGTVILLADVGIAGRLHRRERLASLLLLGAGALVQAIIWLAVLGIIGRAFGD